MLSLREPGYRKRLHERFGFTRETDIDGPLLWVHAVSVGEVHAARPLIDHLQKQYPQYRILVTTMTPTGADMADRQFGGAVIHRYIPYDLPAAVKRFLACLSPALLIVMETEIWPNLFFYCRRNNIPVVIANARLSEQSCAGYRHLAPLTRATLARVNVIAARDQADAQRFISLGADAKIVSIMGNLKFDISLPDNMNQQVAGIRHDLADDRPMWIAASTHEGEEQIILAAHAEILKQHPACLLIIAPRHPRRFDMVMELSIKAGFSTIRKTRQQRLTNDVQVFILDTLGELPAYYGASNLAFTGGSLVPAGGHNMLEPASLGLPVIAGPHNHNFEEIAGMLEAAGALWIVHDSGELTARVNRLLADVGLRRRAGEQGKKLVESNRGSVNVLLRILEPYLRPEATSGSK